ncbi:MAG: GNAT family N-acetyltransferase [Dehalococcoidales bacterium]
MIRIPYVIRNYRPSDFDDYVNLTAEAEKRHPAGRRTSPLRISENLARPNYSPEQDLFIAETTGKPVGFMDITPERQTERAILDCLVRPEHRGQGLGKKFLAQAVRRARELKVKVLHVNIGQDDDVAKSILPRLGFQVVRHFLELRLTLTGTRLPDDTSVNFSRRHLKSGQENILAQIQNRSFTGLWGYNPNTTEEITYYINLSSSSPKDVLLVYDGDKPVGYCWTAINGEAVKGEKMGRICMLGVDPDYRDRGIGRIALVAGLNYLQSSGVQVAELTVDSENRAARALYHSVGFKEWSRSLWYEKAVD